MYKTFFKKFAGILTLTASLFFTSCYSVFNGGTGGMIVDAESTSVPKRGIANVDIYAYTDCGTRDSDFDSWEEGTVFSPSDTYYGHTTTDAEGSFVISNIVWKENKPDFGKDADYTTIYLIYYHENYGLTKDSTVITSDSTNDTVYAELTAIKKTTLLTINIYDVSTANLSSENVLVSVSVPQTTDTLTTAKPRVYEQLITGNGTISISYPRWKNAEAKANGIENTPEISIYYYQSSDTPSWKACKNDIAAGDYSFLPNGFKINKQITNTAYSISLYGKHTLINFPTVNGIYGNPATAANDGVIISMKSKDSANNFTIDRGETTTYAEALGTTGQQSHGNFQGLGTGYSWFDDSYTAKYSTTDVQFFANGSALTPVKTLRSDVASYNFILN